MPQFKTSLDFFHLLESKACNGPIASHLTVLTSNYLPMAVKAWALMDVFPGHEVGQQRK